MAEEKGEKEEDGGATEEAVKAATKAIEAALKAAGAYEVDDKGEALMHAIAQDYKTGEVLMLAHMNKEALELTIKTGKAHYWSRSRRKIWRKGEESGNEQIVKDILIDCDNDAVLLKVEQIGGACHTGYKSCFYRRLLSGEIVSEKVFDPEKVYGRDEKREQR